MATTIAEWTDSAASNGQAPSRGGPAPAGDLAAARNAEKRARDEPGTNGSSDFREAEREHAAQPRQPAEQEGGEHADGHRSPRQPAEGQADGQPLSDVGIIGCCAILMSAGMATVAASIATTVPYLNYRGRVEAARVEPGLVMAASRPSPYSTAAGSLRRSPRARSAAAPGRRRAPAVGARRPPAARRPPGPGSP